MYTHTLTHTDATGSGSILWKPVEATGQHMSHTAGGGGGGGGGVVMAGGVESMQAEGGEESPCSTPSISPLALPAAARVSGVCATCKPVMCLCMYVCMCVCMCACICISV